MDWADQLRRAGIPADVSFHAGTFLCNAVLYWAHHICSQANYRTQSVFVHLPLTPAKAAESPRPQPSLATPLAAQALRIMLAEMAEMRRLEV